MKCEKVSDVEKENCELFLEKEKLKADCWQHFFSLSRERYFNFS